MSCGGRRATSWGPFGTPHCEEFLNQEKKLTYDLTFFFDVCWGSGAGPAMGPKAAALYRNTAQCASNMYRFTLLPFDPGPPNRGAQRRPPRAPFRGHNASRCPGAPKPPRTRPPQGGKLKNVGSRWDPASISPSAGAFEEGPKRGPATRDPQCVGPLGRLREAPKAARI